MSQRVESLRGAVLPLAAAAAVMTLFLFAGTAGAASRTMTGSVHVETPSAPDGFELIPGVYGRKVGGLGPNIFPPTDGVLTVEAAGATTGTFVGRGVSIAANQLDQTGFGFRVFPAFANVAQVTKSFMTVQAAATFAEGLGALGACPGPGCTASGAGMMINWCPPEADLPASPAPGATGAQIGNWDCPGFGAPGTGNRRMRMTISNPSGRNNFGGTLSLIRNHLQNVWRVPGAPSTPNAPDAQATRSVQPVTGQPFTGGQPNFQYTEVEGTRGPRILAQLNGNGAVAATFGCANGMGTVGGSYMQGIPNGNLGSNCGTNTTAVIPPVQGWGFKMTTGVVSGSDDYPFGLVVTTIAGTPFNPTFTNVPASLGFFFSRHGADEITTGGNRNIVMLGGGLANDRASGNAFFRITNLRMNLSVPEPATGLGLLAGAGMLVGLVRRRSQA
jgi:hypothetical protein